MGLEMNGKMIKDLAEELGLELEEDFMEETEELISRYQERVIKLMMARKARREYEIEIETARKKFETILNKLGGEPGVRKEEEYGDWLYYELFGESFDIGFS